MRNRKNCLAVLLMTTIVVMGCGNQQVEKENPSAVSERASNVQDESEEFRGTGSYGSSRRRSRGSDGFRQA